MILVVAVIALILVLAVPALSSLGAEARLTAAQQTIQALTTRAYLLSLADRTMTAVRFFPAEWDVPADSESERAAARGRQNLAIYSYVGSTVQEYPPFSGNFVVKPAEYFERAKDLGSSRLPEDVWAAPLEALSSQATTLNGADVDGSNPYQRTYDPFGPKFVLNGVIDRLRFNAERDASDSDDHASRVFLNADDFLLVFDPQTGLRTGTPEPVHLRAYAPPRRDLGETNSWGETDQPAGVPYQRYSFSGLVTYRREPFVTLGANADGDRRYELLRDSGRPFLVHRFSGGLLAGLQHPASP